MKASSASYEYISPQQTTFYRLILSPFCNYLVQYLPRSLHPNVLTICGMLCAVTAAFLVIYDSSVATSSVEHNPWIYILASVLHFCYAIFDNLDGKQARRCGMLLD